jgi:hypothetical protein
VANWLLTVALTVLVIVLVTVRLTVGTTVYHNNNSSNNNNSSSNTFICHQSSIISITSSSVTVEVPYSNLTLCEVTTCCYCSISVCTTRSVAGADCSIVHLRSLCVHDGCESTVCINITRFSLAAAVQRDCNSTEYSLHDALHMYTISFAMYSCLYRLCRRCSAVYITSC